MSECEQVPSTVASTNGENLKSASFAPNPQSSSSLSPRRQIPDRKRRLHCRQRFKNRAVVCCRFRVVLVALLFYVLLFLGILGNKICVPSDFLR